MAFCMEHSPQSNMKKKLSQAASLPKDVICHAPIVTIVGKEEMTLENYRGIIEYTDNLIRIQTKTGQIKIIGSTLNIEYYNNDEMKIIGRITCLEYL